MMFFSVKMFSDHLNANITTLIFAKTMKRIHFDQSYTVIDDYSTKDLATKALSSDGPFLLVQYEAGSAQHGARGQRTPRARH